MYAGDIVLVTPAERIYSTACMVMGASVYALVTSRLVGMLLLSRSQTSESTDSGGSGFGTGSGPTTSPATNDFDATLRQLRIPLIFRSILTDYLQVKARNDLFQKDVSVLLSVRVFMQRII